ncbi:glycoside hydrolase family 99-like domain-containing protein [Nocardioides sp. zg-ZUI104]|uniref:glycosyltransferase WbsX family protein n=1 Tax=Nocardioides faecalis TaxID=2803858 RepID=UPI001BD04EE9|nr:glycoside hydrolase family 99-like domain-containing protein [Nocardioides faecalis]MBS4753303.1 glycoside hydrolase family 99-like domain-containing protein [Nocardioides faecalis]
MKTVAFYLPQFHAIRENDEWWGKGFTEWTNVARARPQYEGHNHPRVSTLLGEYDLTDSSIYKQQTELARDSGVDAFCMYFYWFGGHRLLERPVEAWRENTELLPYCLSWANESWSRRWDGKDREVLMRQEYASGFAEELFADLLPHLRAPHYLQVDGRPVFVVHRIDLVPQAREFADRLRRLACEAGLRGIYLIAAETKPGIRPSVFGCDAVAEFPPVGQNTLGSAYLRPLARVRRDFRGRLMSYNRLARRFERRKSVDFVRHPGVAPAWDNTARRQSHATIYAGASPERYGNWLRHARQREAAARGENGLVFVNAWNEWAEGAYLEPDERSGTAYLDVTAGRALSASSATPIHGLFWTYPQMRSLALATAGSVLAVVRRVRARLGFL